MDKDRVVVYSPKWDKRFVDLAKHISSWSKDPSTQIGAVIVDPKTQKVLSMGYNGFPAGIHDTYERLNDRPLKHSLVVHGEMNAIYNAAACGVLLSGATIYVQGLPVCNECAKGIIQVGIRRVVIRHAFDVLPEPWKTSAEQSEALLNEAGVDIEYYER